jgi:hypothetical protein
VDDLVTAAARNNAHWCDAVCRSLGAATRWEPEVWDGGGAPPPFYPDRITLIRGLPAAVVLEGVAHDAACAVKDSFADLDLTADGFSPLFDASWIGRRGRLADGQVRLPWSVVRTEEELAAWSGAVGSPGGFGPALLGDPSVQLVLVREGGEIVAVAALNRSDDVVGVSNVLAVGIDPDDLWADLIALLDERFPGRAHVGYERGRDLEAARGGGFRVLQPLRVWSRPARPPG